MVLKESVTCAVYGRLVARILQRVPRERRAPVSARKYFTLADLAVFFVPFRINSRYTLRVTVSNYLEGLPVVEGAMLSLVNLDFKLSALKRSSCGGCTNTGE